ncbi:endo-1,3-alpha-glucanase family glycosylhydrolase [Rubellicoccus peritrichatus]|uniref:Endo-1,3-alpha-glucanase family glycosylhydrolase n=1 Tax=Rubellicoccus peritrichatus TaxID=3080537 RepID=A0AAQ3QRZ7_9BACT|nr:endo-1,3-alpha-glucanase family glycosylhydrolase [Puniceicoccus sp. CR14]WOO41843.1 endo-1,3-alpha-glucanase family glycosylhydrolase [Puniceicoccus sp. CR14]
MTAFSACVQDSSSNNDVENATVSNSNWNIQSDAPILAAHYMPWFSNPNTAQGDNPNWSHWAWKDSKVDRNPEVRQDDNRRDIASIQYPLIGPYSSDSDHVIRYHMKTAKSAGIDAFFVIWYGPGSDTDKVIPKLLEEAELQDMKLAICYEEKLNWTPYRKPESREDIVATTIDDLNYVIDEYSDHPAYLRRGGKPFIYQFNYWGEDDLGPRSIQPNEWEEIFNSLGQPIVYARQNLSPQHHPNIDGAYLWWTTDESYIKDFASFSRHMIDEGQLEFFMSMIAPGFDDSGVNGWGEGSRITPRAGLSLLKDTFERAWQHDPEVIQVVTWNDFNEGTALEPTLGNGFQYLDALESWWSEKTGRPANLEDNREAFMEYLQVASPEERSEVLPQALQVANENSDLKVSVPNYLETID